MENSFKITGMKCQGCASTVTNAIQTIDGVQSVTVDLQKNTVTIQSHNNITVEEINKVLLDTTYKVS